MAGWTENRGLRWVSVDRGYTQKSWQEDTFDSTTACEMFAQLPQALLMQAPKAAPVPDHIAVT